MYKNISYILVTLAALLCVETIWHSRVAEIVYGLQTVSVLPRAEGTESG
jgi:hypothetical protein